MNANKRFESLIQGNVTSKVTIDGQEFKEIQCIENFKSNVTKEIIVQQIIDLHVNKEIYEKLAKS